MDYAKLAKGVKVQKDAKISSHQSGKRRFFPSATALGLILNIGSYSATINSIPLNSLNFYATLLLWVILCNVIFNLLDYLIYKEKSSHAWSAIVDSTLHFFTLKLTAKSLILDTIKILICWLPYIVLLYPGIMYWDSGDQLAQYFGISAWNMEPGQIWDHHPFFDAYLYGFFLSIGRNYFASLEIGSYLYCIFQCVFAAMMFICVLIYFKNRNVRRDMIAATALFYCFFPPIPILFMSIVKDVTHLLFFVPWCLLFAENVRLKNGDNKKKLCLIVALTLFGVLSALTKKMGLYVILAASVFVLLSRKCASNKFRLAVSTLIVYIISNVLIPIFLFPSLNVVPGGPQAALALPIQQVARVAKAYPEDATKEEKEAIDSFLLVSWDQMADNYNPYIADPVTSFNVKDKTKVFDFIKAWISIGLRHPLTYLNAFFSLESGWISFSSVPQVADPEFIEIMIAENNEVEESSRIADLNEVDESSQITDEDKVVKTSQTVPLQIQVRTSTDVNPDTLGLIYPTHISSESSDIIDEVYAVLLNTPVINTLFFVAIWTAVVPFYCLHAIFYTHRRGSRLNYIALCAPYFLSVCSLFVYAVSLSLVVQDNPTRYMFHTIVLAPLFLSLVVENRRCASSCLRSTSLNLSSK